MGGKASKGAGAGGLTAEEVCTEFRNYEYDVSGNLKNITTYVNGACYTALSAPAGK